jgi:CRISPR-associated protein Cas2
VIVVVLSVTPEKLRGELTCWLLEIAAGVYVGHVPARVRELLWARIVDDVGRGRALMVWSRRGEQRLDFRVHNHGWTPEDYDGVTLMRRVTAESRALAVSGVGERESRVRRGACGGAVLPEDEERAAPRPRHWSNAGRRRAYRSIVEQRRSTGSAPEGGTSRAE